MVGMQRLRLSRSTSRATDQGAAAGFNGSQPGRWRIDRHRPRRPPDQCVAGRRSAVADPAAKPHGTIPFRSWRLSRSAIGFLTMHLLLIHQNFPGQFRDLAPLWLAAGHQVHAIGSAARSPQSERWQGLIYHRYHFQIETSPPSMSVPPAWHAVPSAAGKRCASGSGAGPQRLGGGPATAARLGTSMPIVVYPELWGHPQALGFGFDDALNGMSRSRRRLQPAESAELSWPWQGQ